MAKKIARTDPGYAFHRDWGPRIVWNRLSTTAANDYSFHAHLTVIGVPMTRTVCMSNDKQTDAERWIPIQIFLWIEVGKPRAGAVAVTIEGTTGRAMHKKI